MVPSDIERFASTLSVVRGEAEDLINALDQLSDISPVSDELLDQVDTWANVVYTLRNDIAAELESMPGDEKAQQTVSNAGCPL